MILALAAALTVASPAPPSVPQGPSTDLAEAAHAIDAGRIDQARQMLAAAVSKGASGSAVDRLLADLYFAGGDDARAFGAYQALLAGAPNDPHLLERAGIAAYRIGEIERATALLDRAIAQPQAGWRAWNARACLADLAADWALADRAYARAAALAPEQPDLLNNEGWSKLLRGDVEAAIPLLEHAVTLAPGISRAADNLELARAAASGDLPRRHGGEADEAFAARLNDAGVVAARIGQRERARAAFAQAIDARPEYYARAANNLTSVTPIQP